MHLVHAASAHDVGHSVSLYSLWWLSPFLAFAITLALALLPLTLFYANGIAEFEYSTLALTLLFGSSSHRLQYSHSYYLYTGSSCQSESRNVSPNIQ